MLSKGFPPVGWYDHLWDHADCNTACIMDVEDCRFLTSILGHCTPEERLAARIDALFTVFGHRIVEAVAQRSARALHTSFTRL